MLGFGLDGISVGRGKLSGGLDVTLRSPTPLATSNTISPQFYDVHIQLEYEHLKIILGQYPDILLPFVPDTANSFPSGYLPGAIGYARPQVRADGRVPMGQRLQLLIKVSADQPVQTFDLTNDAVAGRVDVPTRRGGWRSRTARRRTRRPRGTAPSSSASQATLASAASPTRRTTSPPSTERGQSPATSVSASRGERCSRRACGRGA